MKARCPKCGTAFQLAVAVEKLREKEVQDIAAKLGPNWQQAWEYTDCFRQSEYGDITGNTRWRLLREVSELMENCTFQNKGKRFRTNSHEIVKAMWSMCNRYLWGLKSHGYLFAILQKTAERLSAEGLTAREEEQRELNRRSVEPQNSKTAESGKFDFQGTIKKLEE